MEKFAKLYDTEEHGQIVVMKDTTEDDDYCVFFYFKTPEVENVKIGFNYDSEDSRNSMFDKVTEEKAIAGVSAIKKKYFE